MDQKHSNKNYWKLLGYGKILEHILCIICNLNVNLPPPRIRIPHGKT